MPKTRAKLVDSKGMPEFSAVFLQDHVDYDNVRTGMYEVEGYQSVADIRGRWNLGTAFRAPGAKGGAPLRQAQGRLSRQPAGRRRYFDTANAVMNRTQNEFRLLRSSQHERQRESFRRPLAKIGGEQNSVKSISARGSVRMDLPAPHTCGPDATHALQTTGRCSPQLAPAHRTALAAKVLRN